MTGPPPDQCGQRDRGQQRPAFHQQIEVCAGIPHDKDIQHKKGQPPERQQRRRQRRPPRRHHRPRDGQQHQPGKEVGRVVKRPHLHKKGHVKDAAVAQPVGEIPLRGRKVVVQQRRHIGDDQPRQPHQRHRADGAVDRAAPVAAPPAHDHQQQQRHRQQPKLIVHDQPGEGKDRAQCQPARPSRLGELPQRPHRQRRQHQHRGLILGDARQPQRKAVDGQQQPGPQPDAPTQQPPSQPRRRQDAAHAHQRKR